MVSREHSIEVPGKDRVEGCVEDQTNEGEVGRGHVELHCWRERKRERERERERI